MRRTIAQRLTASIQTIPHFYLTMDCDIGKLVAAREEINAAAPKDKEKKPLYKLSVNDFVIKAMAIALQRIPNCNVSWTDSGMLKHKHSDIGVAVAMPGGLITPIIRKAETKSLSTISAEMKDFAARARARKLKPEEYQGGTTAVSNLGMYGINDFTAVINPPHATILAVGTSEERPVVRSGKIEIATMMSVTLVVRSPRHRRRARRRADRRVQDADRKSRDDDGVRRVPARGATLTVRDAVAMDIDAPRGRPRAQPARARCHLTPRSFPAKPLSRNIWGPIALGPATAHRAADRRALNGVTRVFIAKSPHERHDDR